MRSVSIDWTHCCSLVTRKGSICPPARDILRLQCLEDLRRQESSRKAAIRLRGHRGSPLSERLTVNPRYSSLPMLMNERAITVLRRTIRSSRELHLKVVPPLY